MIRSVVFWFDIESKKNDKSSFSIFYRFFPQGKKKEEFTFDISFWHLVVTLNVHK